MGRFCWTYQYAKPWSGLSRQIVCPLRLLSPEVQYLIPGTRALAPLVPGTRVAAQDVFFPLLYRMLKVQWCLALAFQWKGVRPVKEQLTVGPACNTKGRDNRGLREGRGRGGRSTKQLPLPRLFSLVHAPWPYKGLTSHAPLKEKRHLHGYHWPA
jgi:hypothetical protein